MVYYDMAMMISSEGYYSHLLPDFCSAAEPSSVDPKAFAVYLNKSPQRLGLKCIVYKCGKGTLRVAAAADMTGTGCKSHMGEVYRWICEGLELEEKHLTLKEKTQISATLYTMLLQRAVYGELCSAESARKLLRQTVMAERSARKTAVEEIKTVPAESGYSAEEQLSRLVGLAPVKELMKSLAATGSIRKLRMEAGLPDSRNSMHMVFTGNPGTAKTTVARLTAQLLHENDLLPTANLVECGRSQLVGEYVGWTAVQVRQRFEEARGGVLLIDEAYSLANDSGKYGQEAIDTIVQEMENRRDDTVVIFTGYPGPMENFLEMNEGLRSRIGFHLNFADYTAEELLQILRRMAEERGYSLTAGAERNALAILDDARTSENFGNGRFVRKLLEQAQLSQARRLEPRAKAGKDLSRAQLSRLSGKDLQEAGRKLREGLKRDEQTIGFRKLANRSR